MSDLSLPGVAIEEQPGPRPIEGVGTSTAGFAGITERGPEYPCLTTSWLEYRRWFGGGLSEAVSYLPHAVRGFFDNGGQTSVRRASRRRERAVHERAGRPVDHQGSGPRSVGQPDLHPDPPPLGQYRARATRTGSR